MAGWNEISRIAALNAMVSFMVLMMLQVLFGQIMVDTIVQAADSRGVLTTIIFIGFIVVLVVSLAITSLTSETIPALASVYANALAAASAFILLYSVSFITILDAYPAVVPSPEPSGSLIIDILGRGVLFIFAAPQVFALFAIYIVRDVFTTWVIGLAAHIVIFSLFAKGLTKNQ